MKAEFKFSNLLRNCVTAHQHPKLLDLSFIPGQIISGKFVECGLIYDYKIDYFIYLTMSAESVRYVVVYAGGVTVRSNPDTESPALRVMPVNSVLVVRRVKEDVGVTFLELADGNWVVAKKGALVTCVVEVVKPKKFKVVYDGGVVVRREPDLNSPSTGRTLPRWHIIDVAKHSIPSANGNTFIELVEGGFVLQQLNGREVCKEMNEALEEASKSNGLGGTDRVGQITMMRMFPDMCGDTAAASKLGYECVMMVL